jgi:type I restriction enzyme M protein
LRRNGQIYSHIRKKWLIDKPEESIRQEFLCVLVGEYGYAPDQIGEEVKVTGRGSARASADFAIWRTPAEKRENKPPLLVVECKSDSVAISAADYAQGENYAKLAGARFVVTHNSRETKFWRVKKDRMPGYMEEIENIPAAGAADAEIEELISRLKIFRKDEFADCLHQCHNVIRNREKRDPAEAFDEIAKVLFVKMWVEREMRRLHRRKNLFSVETLEEQLGDNPLNDLFGKTKKHYEDKTDYIFNRSEQINLKPATGREVVRLLERYNLSDTGEDVKGLAFERFLGRTFRGEIGQFFTPRCVVEFMIRMLEPKEGEIVCDPASGSGGFLIRFFEIVREQILSDIDREYRAFNREIDRQKKIGASDKAKRLRAKFDKLQESADPFVPGSRAWKLANACIFGADANERMARTSKMNMIMHGDGHGYIHHADGFININGIFEGRFDLVLTNPPFGAKVEATDFVEPPPLSAADRDRYIGEFGERYKNARERLDAAKGNPIASLFSLPKNPERGKINTEILFIERCLDLLKPGGRMGIVLPDGALNNPSLGYVREFCEARAFVRAVVSLPPETFLSIGATVKASLLFLQKFTEQDRRRYAAQWKRAQTEVRDKYAAEIAAQTGRLEAAIKSAPGVKARAAASRVLANYQRDTDAKIQQEARPVLRARFAYPVFLYNAQKVGISSTGDEDENELYPNKRKPADVDKTALELYRDFRKDPRSFLA